MICDDPFYVLPKAAIKRVPVPCGRCAPCKRRRVNSWVFRLMQEERLHQYAHFVTLTYDTVHVPISDNGYMTLLKSDFQNYMKRLRKLCITPLKYYACGEYGGVKGRPHYHAIIFGVDHVDKFHLAWSLDSVPIGSVFVGSVSSDSVAYTMKYIDKPSFKRLHSRDDRYPEFALMSKHLGVNYLTPGVIDYHRASPDRLHCTTSHGYKIAMPRYYRNIIWNENERRNQITYINDVISESDKNNELEFNRMYNVHSINYERYKILCKLGRSSNFYSSQKIRNF